jgi:hypothetical protein
MTRTVPAICFVACLAGASVPLASSAAKGQAAAEIVISDGQAISRSYESWSLFLVCNAVWLASGEAAQNNMRDLYLAFGVFGKIIGNDNLAVWFRKSAVTTPSAAEAYDADEAANYCIHYGLSANDSPHIVVTTTYPAKNGSRGNYYAISLNGLDNQNRLKLLNTIRDRIVMSDFRAVQFDSDRYWRGWTQILQESAQILGQAIASLKFTVDARAVKLEFDGSRISH